MTTSINEAKHELINVTIDNLAPPAFQMRTSIDVDDLMLSINEHGVLEPLVVRPTTQEDLYQIVCGHRRYTAVKQLAMENKSEKKLLIPVVVITGLTDDQAFEMSLTENIQRKSLTPMEEARAFQVYLKGKKYGDVKRLANKIGKQRDYIYERLKLLKTGKEAKTEIPTSIASEIARLPTLDDQRVVLDEVTTRIKEKKPLKIPQVRKLINMVKKHVEKNGATPLEENIGKMVEDVTRCPNCNKPSDTMRTITVCEPCADKIQPKPVKVEAPEKVRPKKPLEVKPKKQTKEKKKKK